MLRENKQSLRVWMVNFRWALRHRLWHFSVWQWFYLRAISIFRLGLYENAVHEDTDVVIEGFPRSANTFLVHALELAVNDNMRIAHHLHDPCQIKCAVRNRVPCFVIVRDPLDAAVSWKLKEPFLDTGLMLQIYGAFYRYVIRFEQSVVFLRYSDVILHTAAVIFEIVQRCAPNKYADLTAITEERVFHSIDERKHARKEIPGKNFELSVARPSETKEQLKQTLRDDVAKNHSRLLSEISVLYEDLTLRCLNIQQKPSKNIRSI